MSDYATARLNMVEGQIRPNGVTDGRIVDAFLNLPREMFLPRAKQAFAYVDEDLALGNRRFLMEPMVLARLIQEAGIRASDVVLEVGSATGYATALMAKLAGTVVGIESDPALTAQATENLRHMNIDNAAVMSVATLSDGYPQQAPYDVILIGGAVAEVPPALLAQLAEGGRLLAVVAAKGRLGQATFYQKMSGAMAHRTLFDATTPLLTGFERRPQFAF